MCDLYANTVQYGMVYRNAMSSKIMLQCNSRVSNDFTSLLTATGALRLRLRGTLRLRLRAYYSYGCTTAKGVLRLRLRAYYSYVTATATATGALRLRACYGYDYGRTTATSRLQLRAYSTAAATGVCIFTIQYTSTYTIHLNPAGPSKIGKPIDLTAQRVDSPLQD